MNEQELIKEFEENGIYCLNVFGNEVKSIPVKRAIDLIKQLDGPEPVKVPQFVAEHIEHSKEIGRDLQDAMNSSLINKQVDQWLYTKNNMETFARAWLDGYEVEEEKRYLVKFKGVYHGDLGYAINFGGYSFYCKERSLSGIRFTHTYKELEEANFGWVFSCEGIEIEEVE